MLPLFLLPLSFSLPPSLCEPGEQIQAVRVPSAIMAAPAMLQLAARSHTHTRTCTHTSACVCLFCSHISDLVCQPQLEVFRAKCAVWNSSLGPATLPGWNAAAEACSGEGREDDGSSPAGSSLSALAGLWAEGFWREPSVCDPGLWGRG